MSEIESNSGDSDMDLTDSDHSYNADYSYNVDSNNSDAGIEIESDNIEVNASDDGLNASFDFTIGEDSKTSEPEFVDGLEMDRYDLDDDYTGGYEEEEKEKKYLCKICGAEEIFEEGICESCYEDFLEESERTGIGLYQWISENCED